jgi:hypothetical protein
MAAAPKRFYGSGRLFTRADAAGRETWYGSWRVGGRRVKRPSGAATTPPSASAPIKSRRTSRPAASDTTKPSQAPAGRQHGKESARRRSGPSPRRRTTPTSGKTHNKHGKQSESRSRGAPVSRKGAVARSARHRYRVSFQAAFRVRYQRLRLAREAKLLNPRVPALRPRDQTS